MWEFDWSPKFTKQYKKLNPEIKPRVLSILKEFRMSKDPLEFGIYKPRLKAWAYKINKSYRLLYNTNKDYDMIELIRVGDHKQVYGKD